jgi:hypothetical protein
MVRTQTEAKRFFVDKVLRQADAEGVRLSETEHQMLSWSESDPDFLGDLQLPQRLASEMSDEAYEKKIRELLTRSFAADEVANPASADQWKQASDVLHQGDHYILVMIDEAITGRVKRWWQFWR